MKPAPPVISIFADGVTIDSLQNWLVANKSLATCHWLITLLEGQDIFLDVINDFSVIVGHFG